MQSSRKALKSLTPERLECIIADMVSLYERQGVRFRSLRAVDGVKADQVDQLQP